MVERTDNPFLDAEKFMKTIKDDIEKILGPISAQPESANQPLIFGLKKALAEDIYSVAVRAIAGYAEYAGIPTMPSESTRQVFEELGDNPTPEDFIEAARKLHKNTTSMRDKLKSSGVLAGFPGSEVPEFPDAPLMVLGSKTLAYKWMRSFPDLGRGVEGGGSYLGGKIESVCPDPERNRLEIYVEGGQFKTLPYEEHWAELFKVGDELWWPVDYAVRIRKECPDCNEGTCVVMRKGVENPLASNSSDNPEVN